MDFVIKFVIIFCVFLSNANAITTEYLVQRGFIEAGVFLFCCGLLLVLIPKFTKLGIIFSLLGNCLVISRILFSKEIESYICEKIDSQYINSLSEDDFRLYMGILLIIFMFLIWFLCKLLNFVWIKTWRLLGFYKNEEEIRIQKEKKQRKIEKIHLKKVKLENNEQSMLNNLEDKDIELDLKKVSSIIGSDDKTI